MIAEVIHQRRSIGEATFPVAEGVELEGHLVLQAEGIEDIGAKRDDLDVAERLGDSQKLDVDLVKLPEPSLLRPFVAEHGALAKNLEREVLGKTVGEEGPRHPGRAFWPEGQAVAAPVGKGVHLLGHDVRGIAQGALEDLGELEDGHGHFGVAIVGGDVARGFHHHSVAPVLGRQNIVGAADGLERRFLGGVFLAGHGDGGAPGAAVRTRVRNASLRTRLSPSGSLRRWPGHAGSLPSCRR